MTGTYMDSVTGIKLNESTTQRLSRNKSIEIVNNVITFSSEKIKIIPIKSGYLKSNKRKGRYVANTDIAVLDLETYVDSGSQKGKVYAAGFMHVTDSTPTIFYINNKKHLDSNEVILRLIDALLVNKYRDTKFYCHNFGGFDVIFILKALNDYNKCNTTSPYSLEVFCRNDSVLSLKISKLIGNTTLSITLNDSFAILPQELKALSVNYGCDTVKGSFPHTFANENTLFYKGVTPPKTFYKDIESEDYDALYSEEWDFKGEAIKYLEKDLISLSQVLDRANKQFASKFNITMTDSITISKIALQMFLLQYYPEPVIPLINDKKLYSDIKESYYGGITEVYKLHGKNIKGQTIF